MGRWGGERGDEEEESQERERGEGVRWQLKGKAVTAEEKRGRMSVSVTFGSSSAFSALSAVPRTVVVILTNLDSLNLDSPD
jgi:hypothetical protein